MIETELRFKSGEICTVPGWYRFDGYADCGAVSPPTPDAADVLLGIGDLFPAIHAPRCLCYWRRAEIWPTDWPDGMRM